MNRVIESLETVKADCERHLRSAAGRRSLKKLGRGLAIDRETWEAYQDVREVSERDRQVTPDESLAIRDALGQDHAAFNGRPIHVRIAVSKILGELYENRKKARNERLDREESV